MTCFSKGEERVARSIKRHSNSIRRIKNLRKQLDTLMDLSLLDWKVDYITVTLQGSCGTSQCLKEKKKRKKVHMRF